MRLLVVTGPPCAGKSSHVDEHRAPGDLVVDLDRIAGALGHEGDHLDWADPSGVHQLVARIARAAVVKALLTGALHVPAAAWVIETSPQRWQLAAYRRRGAEFIHLDPGREVCHERATADSRPKSTHAEIDAWYDANGGTAAEFFD